tara:strand:- start:202 stop:387 length:186 start_codon:yes stop_codon:yes gene_type:complete
MDRLAIKQLILTVAIIVFATLAVIDGAKQALAQDVKYCRYADGSLVAVEANMPCPSGSIEL